MDRINQLKQFALEEPDDPFNHYALALEYLKADPVEASRIFAFLVASHPGYLPTYYPYAQLLAEQKNAPAAERIFRMGIEMATVNNDLKTGRELRAAFDDWKYENDL